MPGCLTGCWVCVYAKGLVDLRKGRARAIESASSLSYRRLTAYVDVQRYSKLTNKPCSDVGEGFMWGERG